MKQWLFELYCRLVARGARRYIKKHKPTIIGIHGSVGKTSCRMIIHQTLSQFLSPQKIYTSPQNFNGELGLTLSIFMIESFPPHLGSYLRLIVASFRRGLTRRKKYDIIVLEYGIDRPGEMQFLLSIARPHIGIITKLDKVHTQQFGDPDTLAHEELLMLKKTKHIVILNDEESYCHTIAEKLKHTKEIFWYTTKKPEKTEIPEDNIVFSVYHAKIIKQRDQIMSNFLCKIGKKRLEVTTNMVEHQNYGYIAVGLSIADILFFKKTQKSLFEVINQKKLDLTYQIQPGRFSLFEGYSDSLIIDSTYNASPLSIKAVINNALILKNSQYKSYQLLLVLGDMRELGNEAEREHRMIAGYCNQAADYCIFVGDLMQRYTIDEMKKIGHNPHHIKRFRSSVQAGIYLKQFLKEQNNKYIVVVKGSQNTIFLEECVKQIMIKPEEHKLLCRQSSYRMRKKNDRFQSIH